MEKMIHILGGGTFSHVRNHLSLSVPAFGETAIRLSEMFSKPSRLHLTRMADSRNSKIVTNDDVRDLLDSLVADPETRVIIMNMALCDYDGKIIEDRHGEEILTASGKYETRLQTRDGMREMALTPSEKLLGRIRKTRKDIFLVGFKTTCGATPDEQYRIGLELLKKNSANLILANDTKTRHNMIIAPEETRYFETDDREEVLRGLVQMVEARMTNTFTRSTVVEGELVPWTSDEIPANLREVVDHCVSRGAYKTVLGKTAGHFAVRVDDKTVLTSVRKTNYNETLDLVKIEYDGLDKVIAHGAKPSVGGQSQRIIFDQYPDMDCIVHFHCEMRPDARDRDFIVMDMDQVNRECGSVACGKSVADKLQPNAEIKAVMIDNHGPNIVYNRNADPHAIIDFIEANFDLTRKTGGLLV